MKRHPKISGFSLIEVNMAVFVMAVGILSLVAANMGISLYSESVRNFIRKDIAIVPVESTHATLETVAAWNAAYQSASFRLFHQTMEQELARLRTSTETAEQPA